MLIPYKGFENSGGAAYSSYVILKVFYEKLEAVVITNAAVNSFTEFQWVLVLALSIIKFYF